MTKDELFDAFYEDASLRFQRCGEAWRQVKSAWNGLVVPYLAIPRSLKDDPPKSGLIIVFKFSGSGRPFAGYVNCDERSIDYEIKTTGWLYWLPVPELPKPDKDEQEFEQWWAEDRGFNKPPEDYKRVARLAFMAARGRRV